MKDMLAKVGVVAIASLIGGYIYIMNNDNVKKTAKRKITKAMDNAENAISKM